MAETITQPCCFCGVSVTVEWNNGVVLPEGVSLLADWLAHDGCLDAALKEDNREQDTYADALRSQGDREK